MPSPSPSPFDSRRPRPAAAPLVKALLLRRITLLLAYGPEDEFAMNALWTASDVLGLSLELLAARNPVH
jgi:hypothetical protein